MLHEPFPVLSLHYQQCVAGVAHLTPASSGSKRVARTPTTSAPDAPPMRRDCFLKRLARQSVITVCTEGQARSGQAGEYF